VSRRPIRLSLRFSVYERDKHTCQYCGAKPPEAVLQIDHVYPVALGGDDRIDNLLTACRDCNIGKGARDPGLPMASRPQTSGEVRASLQSWARWWAQEAVWARDPGVRSLTWEIAAKGDQDPIILRRSVLVNELLPGLVAIGVLQVRFKGTTMCGVSLHRLRGRAPAEMDDPWLPWGLSTIADLKYVPSVSEVH
jgi:5-methylcytosine-specific restriction endonuclease McrA